MSESFACRVVFAGPSSDEKTTVLRLRPVGRRLPVTGSVLYWLGISEGPPITLGTLRDDGSIVDSNNVPVGSVTAKSDVLGTNGAPLANLAPATKTLYVGEHIPPPPPAKKRDI